MSVLAVAPVAPPRPVTERFGRESLHVLMTYVVLLFVVPAPMLIAALGQLGAPATLAAIGCFFWWCWIRVQCIRPDRRGSLVRDAAVAFLLVGVMAYAHSAATPFPAGERSLLDAGLIRLVAGVGLVCLVTDGLSDLDQVWDLVTLVTRILGVICLLALVQAFSGEVWIDRISVPGLTPATGIDLVQRGAFIRPSGTASHPIELASVLGMGMPLAFAVAARPGRRVAVARTVAVLIPVTLLLIGSRTAIVCAAVGFVAMMAVWTPRLRLIAVTGAVLAMAATFVVRPGFLGTLAGMFLSADQDPSVASRTDSYRIVGSFVGHHLWWGRGIGTFVPTYWILDNEYLVLLIGGGVITVASLLALIGVALGTAARTTAHAADPLTRQLACAVGAGTLAGAVSIALFDGFAFPQAAGMLFVSFGLCGAMARVARAGAIR